VFKRSNITESGS